MNFVQGMVRAPIAFDVTLKPVGMSRKVKRTCPEVIYSLTASDRDTAAQQARSMASADGFKNYAVTNVREVKQ